MQTFLTGKGGPPPVDHRPTPRGDGYVPHWHGSSPGANKPRRAPLASAVKPREVTAKSRIGTDRHKRRSTGDAADSFARDANDCPVPRSWLWPHVVPSTLPRRTRRSSSQSRAWRRHRTGQPAQPTTLARLRGRSVGVIHSIFFLLSNE